QTAALTMTILEGLSVSYCSYDDHSIPADCHRRDKIRQDGRSKAGSPANLVQLRRDLEEFPDKPRSPSQPFGVGSRSSVETLPASRFEHPEAGIFLGRHHSDRRERPAGSEMSPVWPGLSPGA